MSVPVVFPSFCEICELFVASEAVPGVVSCESWLSALNISIESSASLGLQPKTKAEAIKVTTSFAAERRDMHVSPEGIGTEELQILNLSVPDAFEHCLNQASSPTPLGARYRFAVKVGAYHVLAEHVPQSCCGRDDPSVGGVLNYGDQVRREMERLGPTIAHLTIGDSGQGARINVSASSSQADVVAEVTAENSQEKPPAISAAPSWDVFKTRSRSSVLVFQDNQLELEQ